MTATPPPAHDVVFAQQSVTIKLAEPQACDGPKLYSYGWERPEMLADRVMLTFQRDPERGWVPQEMSVVGRAVDTNVTASTLRRTWNRQDPELPPSWLTALMRAYRPKETS